MATSLICSNSTDCFYYFSLSREMLPCTNTQVRQKHVLQFGWSLQWLTCKLSISSRCLRVVVFGNATDQSPYHHRINCENVSHMSVNHKILHNKPTPKKDNISLSRVRFCHQSWKQKGKHNLSNNTYYVYIYTYLAYHPRTSNRRMQRETVAASVFVISEKCRTIEKFKSVAIVVQVA